ncbi:hypothetical protein R6Q57_002111 [Mikania cordata]
MAFFAFKPAHNLPAELSAANDADFALIISILRRSKYSFALTIQPLVYEYHHQQFWGSCSLSSSTNGRTLNATIDAHPISITVETISRHLQLNDADEQPDPNRKSNAILFIASFDISSDSITMLCFNRQYNDHLMYYGSRNIISFLVFLSPLPTFHKIYKKKSTEGFQSLPYAVALFSAMLWIYYALLKGNTLLLITINSVGIVIETFYLCAFVFYAPKKARMESLKLITLFIVIGFGLIVLMTQFLVKSAQQRGVVVGWICLAFSLCVFVAPLGVVRQVIKTKSVEYMPILLSVALTISAVMWFFYGLLLGDFNIAIPNTLGFAFGIIQIILYMMYKNKKEVTDAKTTEYTEKTREVNEHELRGPEVRDQNIIDIVKLNISVSADENVPNPQDVAVVRTPVVANHTVEVAA